jgi:hypothetical protein
MQGRRSLVPTQRKRGHTTGNSVEAQSVGPPPCHRAKPRENRDPVAPFTGTTQLCLTMTSEGDEEEEVGEGLAAGN